MSWLVVTPAFNEAARLPRVAQALAGQRSQLIGLWVVVDDGSTDATGDCFAPQDLPFPAVVLRHTNSGGLSGASELLAFRAGVEFGLQRMPHADRIMKLDADIVLPPDYFSWFEGLAPDVGLAGGRFAGLHDRAQIDHVLGGLRAYSRRGYDVAATLPAALGWDILDDVAIRQSGMSTLVRAEAEVQPSRRTGASAGWLSGRYRNGVASRWAGYHLGYFLLRLLRYAGRRPPVLGAAMMLLGYLRAGPGPFSPELKRALRVEQRQRLRALARNPLRWLRKTYSVPRP